MGNLRELTICNPADQLLRNQSDVVRSILRINRFAINRSDFTEGLITQRLIAKQ
jgi:hypothetical protein